MDFDLRLLPAFVALADELHFGRAAERLHIGQPALSQQLGRLEHQLGVTLVDRGPRRVSLTPAGHAFLAGARSALVVAQGAAAAARKATTDRTAFRLGVDIDVPPGLVRRMRRFGAQQDGVELRLTIAQQDDLLAALNRGELDVIAMWSAPPRNAPLRSLALSTVAIHGVVRAGDPLGGGQALPRRLLIDQTLAIYLPTVETRPFYDHLLTSLAVDGRVPRASHVAVVDDAQEAMLDVVEHAGGYTICVEGHLEGMDRPGLVALPFDPPVHADVVGVWPGGDTPPTLAALRAWLKET